MVAAPPGYRAQANGAGTVFVPEPPAPGSPVVGLAPLEAAQVPPEPETLLPAALPCWRPVGAWSRTTAGTTGTGAGFRSWQADVQGPPGAEPAVLGVLLLTLASGGSARLLWAVGNPAQAVLEGEPLLRILHAAAAELPPGEPPDLRGAWLDHNAGGSVQYRFGAEGLLLRELVATTSFATSERTTTTSRDGDYRMAGGELLMRTGDAAERFQVRVFDEFGYGAQTPLRLLGLLPRGGGPELTYARVEG